MKAITWVLQSTVDEAKQLVYTIKILRMTLSLNTPCIHQYLMLSQHIKKALVEDGGFTQSTDDSIATNFQLVRG